MLPSLAGLHIAPATGVTPLGEPDLYRKMVLYMVDQGQCDVIVAISAVFGKTEMHGAWKDQNFWFEMTVRYGFPVIAQTIRFTPTSEDGIATMLRASFTARCKEFQKAMKELVAYVTEYRGEEKTVYEKWYDYLLDMPQWIKHNTMFFLILLEKLMAMSTDDELPHMSDVTNLFNLGLDKIELSVDSGEPLRKSLQFVKDYYDIYYNSGFIESRHHRRSNVALFNLPQEIGGNEDLMLHIVKLNAEEILQAPDAIMYNLRLVKAAIRSSPSVLALYKRSQRGRLFLRANKELILLAVSLKGMVLADFDEEYGDDKRVVLAAVRNDPAAIAFASPRLQDDEEVWDARSAALAAREEAAAIVVAD